MTDTASLLEQLRFLRDASESTTDADSEDEATFIPVSVDEFDAALDEAIAAISALQAQQGAEPVAFPLYEFVSLLMCSDPWPVDDAGYGTGQAALVALADRESQRLGFTDWIDAIHQLKAPATGAPR